MSARRILVSLCIMTLAAAIWAGAQEQASNTKPSAPAGSESRATASHAAAPVRADASARIEGEKRFKSNCGRCHMAPPKFPPRIMATIVRHMRVRATITDEDTRLILKYMTE